MTSLRVSKHNINGKIVGKDGQHVTFSVVSPILKMPPTATTSTSRP